MGMEGSSETLVTYSVTSHKAVVSVCLELATELNNFHACLMPSSPSSSDSETNEERLVASFGVRQEGTGVRRFRRSRETFQQT
jgi:hypothetical protein